MQRISGNPNKMNLEIAKVVLDTNYFVVKNVTKTLLPLLCDDTFLLLCVMS